MEQGGERGRRDFVIAPSFRTAADARFVAEVCAVLDYDDYNYPATPGGRGRGIEHRAS
jgi:hypothetical protein